MVSVSALFIFGQKMIGKGAASIEGDPKFFVLLAVACVIFGTIFSVIISIVYSLYLMLRFKEHFSLALEDAFIKVMLPIQFWIYVILDVVVIFLAIK